MQCVRGEQGGGGGCGVNHREVAAAEKHSRRLNNLHVGPCRYGLPRGPNSPYCPACDGGAYLDYRPQRGQVCLHGRGVDEACASCAYDALAAL